MSASEPSHTQQDALRRREAIADMQERLAQFGRLVGQLRDELPEQHVQALSRIEQGIGSLAERIAAFGPDDQSHQRGSAAIVSASPANPDDPWDQQSAEALMQAHETAQAELASAGPAGQAPRYRHWPSATKAAGAHAPPAFDPAQLEARFADIAGLLQSALADNGQSLAVLDRRLDQFERRLETALGEMALGSDRERLKLIDAHVAELAGHFEAIRQQLGHLDAMDGQLRELTRALDDHRQPQDGLANLSEDALAALIDMAAERAASRIAGSVPTEPAGAGRIDALEGLLHDYIAERRRSDEVTTGILHTIEDALVRIIDRVEAMEAVNPGLAAAADHETQDGDSIESEHDRLAEAYAEGARVLGQQGMEPSLHAADYVATDRREERMPAAESAAQVGADAPPPQEEQARRELRASALRAKQKAQATPPEPAADSAEPDEGKSAGLGHGRIRTWTSARAGSHRTSLLLGGAMAFLFGTGFVAVDALLGSTPPAAARPQPAAPTGMGELAPRSGDWKLPSTPMPQPAPRRPTPEAADDPGQAPSPPARRLHPVQTGMATPPSGAMPAVLASQEDAAASPTGNDGNRSGTGAELPPAVGTPKLRQAAVAGDAFAQFEVATRFAEGKGVAQDHKQAFAWYERAATRGLASAQFRLAAYFERGVGVDPDRERAKVWYGRAADQGYVRAMHNLGVLTVGNGERQADYAVAARWFGQAAERGLADSQFNLAILNENGRGVPRDLLEAYKWFALAARSGDPVAARRLEQVKARMEPPEIEAAERKLAAWRPSPAEAVTGSLGASARR